MSVGKVSKSPHTSAAMEAISAPFTPACPGGFAGFVVEGLEGFSGSAASRYRVVAQAAARPGFVCGLLT